MKRYGEKGDKSKTSLKEDIKLTFTVTFLLYLRFWLSQKFFH